MGGYGPIIAQGMEQAGQADLARKQQLQDEERQQNLVRDWGILNDPSATPELKTKAGSNIKAQYPTPAHAPKFLQDILHLRQKTQQPQPQQPPQQAAKPQSSQTGFPAVQNPSATLQGAPLPPPAQIPQNVRYVAQAATPDEALWRAYRGPSAISGEAAGQKEKQQHEYRLDEINAHAKQLTEGGWTRNGQPVLVDGQWVQPFSNKLGENKMEPMPPGYNPRIKGVKGTLVRSQQSPTGFAQTWVDPFDPQHVTGWQPVTASRYLEGTQTSRTTTDPFGLKTTSGSVTQPLQQGSVDLSNFERIPPDEDLGVPPVSQNTPPPSPAKPTFTPRGSSGKPPKIFHPSQAKAAAKASPTLDANGHIPPNAGNPYLTQAANSILDGMDVDKLPIPQKDRTGAMMLAEKYGWKGQGLFTPREVLQLKEGANGIDKMLNSKSLNALNEDTISQLPMLGQSDDPTKASLWGRIETKLASSSATPEQQEFLRYWRQLDALAAGLRSLVQTNRATQTQVDRLIAEFPNPYNTTNAEDAKKRLKFVQRELRIAAESGKLPDIPLGEGDDNSDVDQIVNAFKKK